MSLVCGCGGRYRWDRYGWRRRNKTTIVREFVQVFCDGCDGALFTSDGIYTEMFRGSDTEDQPKA